MNSPSAWMALAASCLSNLERDLFAPPPPPPAPEKYPGQRQAFRKGAWKGDGVPADPNRSRGRKCTQP